MRKTVLFLGIIFCFQFVSMAQTYGHLTVSTTTSETGGNYAPRNIVAIWVENENGDFIKTLMAYAQNRITHLNTWQARTAAAGVEYDRTDAITGATRTSHGTRECLWNGLDYNQNLMADGTYYVWMELTDKNGTGNYSSFAFTKGIDQELQNPSNVPSFSDITILWEPSGTGILEEFASKSYFVTNNPGTGIYQIKGEEFETYEIRSMNGELILEGSEKSVDISKEKSGMYMLIIKNKSEKMIQKIIKN